MAGLNDLIARLERFSSQQVIDQMGRKIADACHAQCLAGFRGQRDPYGTPWAPRKDKRGNWPLLDKTGAGVDSLTSRYSAGMVRMRIRGYFRFHQSGTAVMPSRKVFPEQASGLGTWSEPINRAATDAVRELMR
jgi:hypothetical protein